MTSPVGSDWQVEHHGCVDSTQALARGRPAWSAVVAQEQSAGRGQAERTFQSDPGGLYVTTVLPYAGDPLASRGFALAVGWALREMLQGLGVGNLRLRWPNDLMVGVRKVGGILVEQDGPDTVLVGIGLNVTNQPGQADSSLAGTAGRLSDAMAGRSLPDYATLTASVLRAVRVAHEEFLLRRLAGFATRLEPCWGPPREVEIEPAQGVIAPVTRGRFCGIDAEGQLLLETKTGCVVAIPAHYVGRLRETGV